MLKRAVFWVGILFCFSLQADGVLVEQHGRDLYVRSSFNELLVKDVFGDKDGVDRVLVSINGRPAVFVLGSESFYYTLSIDGAQVAVDCVYVDGRNKSNGARVSIGECGLNTLLQSNFYETGMELLAKQNRSVYSFDTKAFAHRDRRYLIGEMNGMEFVDEYLSEESFIDSRPVRTVRWKGLCYKFDADLMFLTSIGGAIKYVDVVRSLDPMRIQRLDEDDVRSLLVDRCS